MGLEPISILSKTFLSSKYSHVGVVVHLPEYGDRPLFFEATIEGEVPDVQDNFIKYGTQLVDLRDKIQRYYGAAVWRPVMFERTPETTAKLRGYIEEVRNKPYESDKFELVRAYFGTNTKSDTNAFFCSALVAETFVRLGIIRPSNPSDNYLPSFFSHEFDESLPLKAGAKLGVETVINPWNLKLSLKEHYILSGCTPAPELLHSSTEVIVIKVMKGRDLTHRIEGFTVEPMSDPGNVYVEINLGLPPTQAALVTTNAKKGFSPEWNETLQIPFVSRGCLVKLLVKEKRVLLEDPTVGYAVLDLANLASGEERTLNIRLQQGYVQATFARKAKSAVKK